MISRSTPELNDNLYQLFRDLLRKRSGLAYPEQKRDDLEHGLVLAMNSCSIQSLDELYSQALTNEKIWESVLHHLTIGETSFFRNRPQFDALRNEIIPELLERRAMTHNLRIWSAGCATGEEPYSLAILLQETIPNIAEWHISMLATDINLVFLERARQGLYGSWSFRENSEDFKTRYFTQEKNRWLIKPEIRSMVIFNRLNLIEPVYPSIITGTSALDMIMCRNVTIYFDEPTTRQVVQRFYHALAPGGWLIVGHSEPQAHTYYQFEVYNFPNTVLYRKPLNAPMFSSFDGTSQMVTADYPAAPLSSASPYPRESVLSSLVTLPLALPDSRISSTYRPVSPEPETTPNRSGSAPAPLPPAPDELWSTITTLIEKGNKTRAEQLLNTLLQLQPDHVDALTMLGNLYADRGEWACAQYHCERAISSNPLHTKAHYILAQIHEHEQQYEAALSEYRRVVFLDRNHIMGMFGMANVWRQMGRLDDARRSYRNVLKLLATYSPQAKVPNAEGATASELAIFATRQMQLLG